MKLRITILSTLLTVLAAGPLFAGEIYKWTDAEGNVHFGDKPDGARSERVAAAFALYDYNGDGFISLEEMERYVEEYRSEQAVETLETADAPAGGAQ